MKTFILVWTQKPCNLVIDDTDIERSKNVTQIGGAHKIKDKKTGGYFLGQNIVFIILKSQIGEQQL
jgi:hypothetical protein